MENWEKRLEIITDGICFRQSDRENAWWETSEGAKFGKLKLSEIKELFSSELELAKQEEIKISAIKNQSAELYYISAIKELCGAKVLDKVLEKVIELSKKDKKHREGLIASLHQNNNKQGGK